MNLTCIIVDDEPLAIRLLENFVERTPFLVLKASFTDSISALQTIKNDVVDLLFLDIQMPDLNGMELSRMVPSRTRIIFTTAFKEYAFDSYEVNLPPFRSPTGYTHDHESCGRAAPFCPFHACKPFVYCGIG